LRMIASSSRSTARRSPRGIKWPYTARVNAGE
jgi:hypothetical protein